MHSSKSTVMLGCVCLHVYCMNFIAVMRCLNDERTPARSFTHPQPREAELRLWTRSCTERSVWSSLLEDIRGRGKVKYLTKNACARGVLGYDANEWNMAMPIGRLTNSNDWFRRKFSYDVVMYIFGSQLHHFDVPSEKQLIDSYFAVAGDITHNADPIYPCYTSDCWMYFYCLLLYLKIDM